MALQYKQVVDYSGGLDHFKQVAAQAAQRTERALRHHSGFTELSSSRGGSIYLVRQEPARFITTFGLVLETLGTKSLVADQMYKLTGVPHFGSTAKDGVAMIVNDAATGGVAPLVINMLLEVGSSDWFKDQLRYTSLINGWADACIEARCVWGGGETPALKGLLYPSVFSLSGAATGYSLAPDPEAFSNGSLIEPGDAIIIILHNGIGANGLSLARLIADRLDPLWRHFLAVLLGQKRFPLLELPKGYLTEMPNGRTYGEALLDPTPLFNTDVEDLLRAGVDLHYVANITGHGWRKFMRPSRPLRYVFTLAPKVPDVLDFICKAGPVEEKDAFETFNMGALCGLYVARKDVQKTCAILSQNEKSCIIAGHVEAAKEREVIVPAVSGDLRWSGKDLDI